MTPSRERASLPLLLLLAAAFLGPALGSPASPAPAAAEETTDPTPSPGEANGEQAAEERIRGRLRVDDEPAEGIEIVALSDGREIGRVRSDADGEWEIPLPGPGSYQAQVDTDTLPEGVDLRDPERAVLEFRIREGQSRTLLFPLGERDVAVSRFLTRFGQAAINGIKFGLIIAMTAIGLSLVYGTTRLVNFAHGDMVTFGAMVALYFNTAGPRLHLIPATVVAIAVGGAFGGALERGLWNPLRRRRTGLIQMLVISIGLALVMRHLILLQVGGRPRPFLDYTVQDPLRLGPILTTPRDLTVILLSTVVLVAVGLLLLRTRLGKAMRAVADNRDLAESSGIDVQRVILFVWVLAGGLASLGGVFLGVVENVDYLMGFRALLLMFAAVILGGLGTAFGAMAGGLVVGFVTEVSTIFQPSELKIMWSLLALILVLLVRPQGLFGRRERVG